MFHETQRIAKKTTLFLIVFGMILFTNSILLISLWRKLEESKDAFMICNGLIIPVLILLIILKLDIRITDTYQLNLLVSSGFTWSSYSFDLNDKSVTYPTVRPLKDFGGWGIRYNFSGEKGLIFEGKSYAKVDKINFSIMDIEGFRKVLG